MSAAKHTRDSIDIEVPPDLCDDTVVQVDLPQAIVRARRTSAVCKTNEMGLLREPLARAASTVRHPSLQRFTQYGQYLLFGHTNLDPLERQVRVVLRILRVGLP